MGLESVGDLAINALLRKLEAEDIARVACASKRFRSFASDDTLWINLCFNELALTQPIDHLGNPFPSFKECYQAWRKAFGMYPWFLVKRVKRCWDRIKTWLTNNFPEAEATLCKGATEADIQMLENLLKVELPLPTRILYRFNNGQEIVKANLEASTFGSCLGLIGGYSFYNHLVNVYLLPVHQIIRETQQIWRHLNFLRTSKFVLVASSSTLRRKLFFLNCSNGQLYVGTNKLRSEKDIIPCVPQDLISLHQESNGEEQQDAMLLWLEEHGRRLEHGFIKLCENEYGRSINLFPEEPPFCSTAVTNGVKVRSSALVIPEFIDPQDDSEKYLFAYSIRLSLEPQGCLINGMSFDSCQLHWRRWIIRANDDVVSDLNGEAVIGQYPLLHPGGQEFVYQSCTPLPTPSGSIEGSFTFIPGSLAYPKGDPFLATVAQFPLQLPDYIF
ncbi:F-box protein SKIP16 [Vigna unguiculata]|uniref:F-box protein SKIP16 n=1 Tax=Vigna unguiculata TaxID=3917 RepID=UPI001016F0D2|nr:F-box protein SKIP16 [Vigna unguiculata]